MSEAFIPACQVELLPPRSCQHHSASPLGAGLLTWAPVENAPGTARSEILSFASFPRSCLIPAPGCHLRFPSSLQKKCQEAICLQRQLII